MKSKQTDVVTEYLHEVDLRLAGLPVLQRRELLADLAAHITAERAERNLQSEGEIIEMLERLGSPEVVAEAAHEEAGTRPFTPGEPRAKQRRLYGVIGAAVLLVLVFCGVLFFAQSSSRSPEQAPAVTVSPLPPSVAPPTR
jgi:uncharacterized membrane protein